MISAQTIVLIRERLSAALAKEGHNRKEFGIREYKEHIFALMGSVNPQVCAYYIDGDIVVCHNGYEREQIQPRLVGNWWTFRKVWLEVL
jgi:hypothetical protein